MDTNTTRCETCGTPSIRSRRSCPGCGMRPGRLHNNGLCADCQHPAQPATAPAASTYLGRIADTGDHVPATADFKRDACRASAGRFAIGDCVRPTGHDGPHQGAHYYAWVDAAPAAPVEVLAQTTADAMAACTGATSARVVVERREADGSLTVQADATSTTATAPLAWRRSTLVQGRLVAEHDGHRYLVERVADGWQVTVVRLTELVPGTWVHDREVAHHLAAETQRLAKAVAQAYAVEPERAEGQATNRMTRAVGRAYDA